MDLNKIITKKTFFLLIILLALSILIIGLIMKTNKVKNQITITLSVPIYKSQISIEEALQRRRSVREFKNEPITLQQVAQLLWAAQGITSKMGFRTAPSAGALYPLEIYLVSGNVTGLPAGIYHYVPANHVLELLNSGDKRKDLAHAALYQHDIQQGEADIVITADYRKTTAKYGSRGERYVYMEAGHAAENICLQVVSLGLGTVTIGSFDDAAVKSVLNVSTRENPLYIMPIGKPAE